MAKRKHRRHRTGSVITTRRINGLGNLKNPSSLTGAVVPPLVGGAVAGGTTLALEQMAVSTSGLGRGMHLGMAAPGWMHDWAPAIGLGAAALVSLSMVWFAGRPQALSSFASAAATSGTLFAKKYLESAPAATKGVRGIGAVVPEQLAGLPAQGVGAIVMEPYGQQGYGNYGGGERVNVSGLSAINAGAFGTPGFEM